MKSAIDWNEIIPRLDPGLRQTVYLEAMRLVSMGNIEAKKRKAAYMRKYWKQYAKKRFSAASEPDARVGRKRKLMRRSGKSLRGIKARNGAAAAPPT